MSALRDEKSYTRMKAGLPDMTARGWEKAYPLRMEAKPAGVPDRYSVPLYACRYPERTQPRESGKRRTSHPTVRCVHVSIVLNGDCLKRNAAIAAIGALRYATLNTRHGNRAFIVVRDGSAAHMAKGGSQSLQYRKERCERHHEKSDSRIEKP